jgi:hypothetical protein
MWKFKSQGKTHIVYDSFPVTTKNNTKNILRIPKHKKKESQEYVRDYHEAVTTLLLGEKYYSPLEVTALDHLVIDGQTMNGWGLLQLDYTTSTTSTQVLTVEIKPKYAISNGSTCDFCRHAYLKHLRGEKEFINTFCPFDLYSLDPARMAKSLSALNQNSRLKIFYNGVLDNNGIFSMYPNIQEYFKDIVKILLEESILCKLNEAHVHARHMPLKKLIVKDDHLLQLLKEFNVLDYNANKFLISKSLMDVSIMIKIENTFSKGSEKIGDYWYTIGVIDVQPKDINKLNKYLETEQDILLVEGIRDCHIIT